MSVSISFNLMTAYGVMRKKKIWLFPFLILYMGFIIECLAASIWITASKSSLINIIILLHKHKSQILN